MSRYYAWRGDEPSQREKDDCALIAVMRKVHEQARGNPGVRRMRAGLAALGHLVSHKRVHRLMRAAGLRGRYPRAWKRTTIGGDRPPAPPAPARPSPPPPRCCRAGRDRVARLAAGTAPDAPHVRLDDVSRDQAKGGEPAMKCRVLLAVERV